MSVYRIAISLICALLLSACATTFQNRGPALPEFVHLTPASLSHTADAIQEVEFKSEKAHLQFQAAVHVDEEQMQVVTLNNLGQRLFSITLQDQQLSLEQGHLKNRQLNENDIIRDIQWLFWPVAVLNNQDSNSGWHFQETGKTRQVFYNNDLVATLTGPFESGWTGEFNYQNHADAYQLHVKSAPYE